MRNTEEQFTALKRGKEIIIQMTENGPIELYKVKEEFLRNGLIQSDFYSAKRSAGAKTSLAGGIGYLHIGGQL
jgi:hypothetical protein